MKNYAQLGLQLNYMVNFITFFVYVTQIIIFLEICNNQKNDFSSLRSEHKVTRNYQPNEGQKIISHYQNRTKVEVIQIEARLDVG